MKYSKEKREPRAASKLLIYFLLYALLFIIILSVCQTLFLEKLVKAVKQSEIKSIAAMLADHSDSYDDMEEIAARRSQRSNVCISAYSMNGTAPRQLFFCDVLGNCIIHKMKSDSVAGLYEETVNNGGNMWLSYRFDISGRRPPEFGANGRRDDRLKENENDSIIYSTVVTDSDGNSIFILLNVVITPLTSTVRTLNLILVFVGLIMVITATVMAVIISSSFVRPIKKIAAQAEKLAEGRYDVTFDGGHYREINDLSHTLNYAADELSKVDGLKKELIANTSHDLRTPLTMISGYAELMRDIPEENTPENAQIIIDETNRLSSLVSDMLDISKLESGNVTATFAEADVTSAVSDALERYSRFKTSEGYKITFFADKKVFAVTDVSKFLQAFCNLVNNALTYTGDDKVINVYQSIYYDGTGKGRLRISVSDTGDGIPPEKLSLIWDRYYKLDGSHRRSVQGSGLGLSIVSRLMTLIGGRCDVFSELGKGSTFSIEIPFSRLENL